MNKTGIYTPSGEFIECPYDKIEALCRKITENYCNTSLENQQKFLDFSSNYKTFSPYFDFVIGTLGYHLQNPWYLENTILVGLPEQRGYLLKKYSKVLEDYIPVNYGNQITYFSSDIDLKIKPFLIEDRDFSPCFITPDLQRIEAIHSHNTLARQILNLGMIKSKTISQEIEKIDSAKKEEAEILMCFFPLLRYCASTEIDKCMIEYHEENICTSQINCIQALLDKGILTKEHLHNMKNKKGIETDYSALFYKPDRRTKDENKRL